MHADAVPLHKVLNSNLQMIIPIFQRAYSWEKEQVKTLWEDIIKLYNIVDRNDKATHFLGPIVRVEISASSVDTRKLYLIDGQQRITTLMVLLACIRNKAKKTDSDIVSKIESGYLLNYQEKGDNYHKLLPSEGDRDTFRKIIEGKTINENSKLKEIFDFLTDKLETVEEKFNFEKLRGIIINKLILVNIDVDKDENPYLIFESLNAKGTPLTQADLIRNYIFMKIPQEEKQKELYKEYWRPMELLLGDELEHFFWRYSLKDGTFVKINRTYANLKSELETNYEKNAESELKKLHLYSTYYKRMIKPDNEEVIELRKRFERHNRWEIRTEYPFLLNIYKDYTDEKVSLDQFCNILDIIESFVIRRFFCKDPTNKLNGLFIGLYKKIDKNDIIESINEELYSDCPDDERFAQGIRTLPIYNSGSEKCSLILETIEESYHHKEPIKAEKLQIEHVMPQASGDAEKLPANWKEMLGPDYTTIHTKYLHTLGNLTLTGYNQELGTKSFEDKKQLLRESHLEMNRYFDSIKVWDENEINKRTDQIIQKAIILWKEADYDDS